MNGAGGMVFTLAGIEMIRKTGEKGSFIPGIKRGMNDGGGRVFLLEYTNHCPYAAGTARVHMQVTPA